MIYMETWFQKPLFGVTNDVNLYSSSTLKPSLKLHQNYLKPSICLYLSSKGWYIFDIHENCPIFKTPFPTSTTPYPSMSEILPLRSPWTTNFKQTHGEHSLHPPLHTPLLPPPPSPLAESRVFSYIWTLRFAFCPFRSIDFFLVTCEYINIRSWKM